MTEEQFNKAISLGKRLTALKELQNLLDDKDMHLSYYRINNSGSWTKACNEVELRPIKDTLLAHEDLIRCEIKAEIASIKKQISEL